MKHILRLLTLSLIATSFITLAVHASSIKLSSKKLTMVAGKTRTVTVKNIKPKKIKSVTIKNSSKKVVKATKKSKTKIKLKALKKGTANLKITIKYKTTKKVKKKILKIRVKVKQKQSEEEQIVKPINDGKGIVIKASTAVLAKGDKGMPTKDTAHDVICDMSPNASAEYTVPKEAAENNYDIYLELSHSNNVAGETMYSITINNKDHYCIPAKVQKGDFNVFGNFLMGEDLNLKPGDKIKVIANEGYNASNLAYIGNMSLYKAGSKVAVGYDNQIPKDATIDPADPLSGKNIIWIGSSVTYGYGSDGYSMADEIEAKHAGTRCFKYAINGTTLVNEGPQSYVARMMKDINLSTKADFFVVQLSTNDASQNKPIGTLTDSFDINSFDDKTVIGAIETIIAYVKNNWNCPVYFYTGTQYSSVQYETMVIKLQQIAQKWNIKIVDLWNNDKMTAIKDTALYKSYMKDPIHPNKKGYVEWWTPEFEKVLK